MDEMIKELLENLEVDLEWAEENEWNAPITLVEDLEKCIDLLTSFYDAGTPDKKDMPMCAMFLEVAIRQLFRRGDEVQSIAIASINTDTSMNYQYWNCEPIDKTIIGACITQDVTLQTLREEMEDFFNGEGVSN